MHPNLNELDMHIPRQVRILNAPVEESYSMGNALPSDDNMQ